MEFNSITDLEKYINEMITKALEEDVAEVARQTMQEKIQTDVYKAYTPTQYERTGGLLQDVEVHLINENTLEIQDTRTDEVNGRLITPVIESGIGYEWTKSEIYQRELPRPFVEETAKALEDGLAKEALIKGLKRQGLIVD